MLTALEMTGKISASHQIELDGPVPENAPERVRVILLFDEAPIEITDREWIEVASANDAFDFLADEKEDIYSLSDGKSMNEE